MYSGNADKKSTIYALNYVFTVVKVMEREAQSDDQPSVVPRVGFVLLILFIIVSRSSTSILTPVWLDSLDNNTIVNGSDQCNRHVSYRHVDAFAVMFITNFLFVVLFGLVLLVTKCLCPYLITDRETSYDKREFAIIGSADTLTAICFVYASSGCRTAPYLQSIAANFSVPVTFFLRFLILRKRPTCRKTICAALVLFAEFTALLPDIFPGLESQRARKDQGGASGLAGILWPLCFFFGYLPMALATIIIEKAVKSKSSNRSYGSNDLNMAYVLFWSYLFNLLSLILFFWTDMIPGFGMADGVLDFAKTFYFNVKCYFGFEGCVGMINVVSILCTVFLVLNRLANAYFLRYMEGANYLAIIISIQTPVVFIFFTLFNENPLKWHPHAYLSTWLSVAALCIMLPSIYIYDTGDPEVQPSVPTQVDTGTQSDEETKPLMCNQEGSQPINRNYGASRWQDIETEHNAFTNREDPDQPATGDV